MKKFFLLSCVAGILFFESLQCMDLGKRKRGDEEGADRYPRKVLNRHSFVEDFGEAVTDGSDDRLDELLKKYGLTAPRPDSQGGGSEGHKEPPFYLFLPLVPTSCGNGLALGTSGQSGEEFDFAEFLRKQKTMSIGRGRNVENKGGCGRVIDLSNEKNVSEAITQLALSDESQKIEELVILPKWKITESGSCVLSGACCDAYLRGEDIENICKMKNLKKLEICICKGRKGIGKCLERLGELPNLVDFTLFGTSFFTGVLKKIFSKGKLERLSIIGNRMIGKEISLLGIAKNVPDSLKVIEFHVCCNISIKCLEVLTLMRNLEKLVVSGCKKIKWKELDTLVCERRMAGNFCALKKLVVDDVEHLVEKI